MNKIYPKPKAPKVSEIFYSLQGEALTSGAPTVFVRLTGCPLRCTYCDTAYAFYGGTRMSIDDIIAQVRTYDCPRVCLTGGEPLAQKSATALMQALLDAGFLVSLETSGAMSVADVPALVSKVMDLKAPSSGECDKNLWDNIAHLTLNDQIKIVIADRADYDWAYQKLAKYDITRRVGAVWLSPMFALGEPTTTAPAIAADIAQWILADKLNARLQLQLHKLIWADAKGK